ncbi:MAG: hypothetical protein CL875_06310 [Dehalococcoidales bacterium]|jgi:hypothetical protein|nr:hypothetical protein [Dehalococcoidales bacterium]
MANSRWQGVLPASVVPFDRKGEVDEPALRKHFRDLLVVEGIMGLVPNALHDRLRPVTQAMCTVPCKSSAKMAQFQGLNLWTL